MDEPGSRRDACVPGVAGLLLTGGSSRRMGRDKASLVVDGETLAARAAVVLASVVSPACEVGPGRSGLPAIVEREQGAGPLAAVASGGAHLRVGGHDGAVLVLATDLPRVSAALLRLVAVWPGDAMVVPVAGGRPQPLCARWSGRAVALSEELVAAGSRAVSEVMQATDVEYVAEDVWRRVAPAGALDDVDTPVDWERVIGTRCGA